MEIDFYYKGQSYTIEVNHDKNVLDFKKLIYQKTKIPIGQQRLEYFINDQKIVLRNDNEYLYNIFGQEKNVNIKVKNLGLQIKYKNLFYYEYIGPLIIWIVLYILFFYLINFFKTILFSLVVIHYIKRLLETKYVHIFSNHSISLLHSMKNFIFYWIIFGVCAGLEILYFKNYEYEKFSIYRHILNIIFILIFLICEIFNLIYHIKLRRLRTDTNWGEPQNVNYDKKIPYGGLFELIISPNYTFEIIAWISYIILSRSYFVSIFILLGTIIMYKWGLDKKKQLYNLQNNTVVERTDIKKRKILIPYILQLIF